MEFLSTQGQHGERTMVKFGVEEQTTGLFLFFFCMPIPTDRSTGFLFLTAQERYDAFDRCEI